MNNTNTIQNLPIKVQDSLSLDILSAENLELVKSAAYSLIDNSNIDGALMYGRLLENRLGQNPAESDDRKYSAHIVMFWVFRLRLFAFSTMNAGEQSDLIKKNSLKIISYGLDLKGAVYKFLNFYGTDKIILENAKTFILSLSANQEVLGARANELMSLGFKPTVENWLKEYQAKLSMELVNSKAEPGAFHILKFIDNSNYVKYLSKEEIEGLKDLLDLYNWLLSPIASINVQNKTNTLPYMSKAQAILPDNLVTPKNLNTALSSGSKFDTGKNLGQMGASGVKAGQGGQLAGLREVGVAPVKTTSPLPLSSKGEGRAAGISSEVAGEIDEKLEQLKKRKRN